MVFSLSPVRLLHSSLWGFSSSYPSSPRLPLLHAQVLRHAQRLVINLSLGLVLRGISDSLPRTVLIHETLLAIALMTVASLKIAHVSDRTGHRRRFASRDPPSPKRRRSSHASSDDEYFGESPSRSSPAPMIPPSLPPFGQWWISFSRPFPSIRLLLPIHRQVHSIYLLLRTWL